MLAIQELLKEKETSDEALELKMNAIHDHVKKDILETKRMKQNFHLANYAANK